MEDIVKMMGFDSVGEFHKLNSSVDISTPTKMSEYVQWKDEDGTKEGLLKLIGR